MSKKNRNKHHRKFNTKEEEMKSRYIETRNRIHSNIRQLRKEHWNNFTNLRNIWKENNIKLEKARVE